MVVAVYTDPAQVVEQREYHRMAFMARLENWESCQHRRADDAQLEAQLAASLADRVRQQALRWWPTTAVGR